MELQGEVVEIIYKNEINSYCIAIIKLDRNVIDSSIEPEDEMTVVGYLPFVNQGDYLKVIREKGRTSRLWGTNQSRNF